MEDLKLSDIVYNKNGNPVGEVINIEKRFREDGVTIEATIFKFINETNSPARIPKSVMREAERLKRKRDGFNLDDIFEPGKVYKTNSPAKDA